MYTELNTSTFVRADALMYDTDASLESSLQTPRIHRPLALRAHTPRTLADDDTASESAIDSVLVAHASVTCPPLKVTLMGESGVGKTSLFNMSRGGSPATPRPTIGVDFFSLVVAECNVRIQLWDTAGMERFAPIAGAYTRNASVLILVYAMDDPATFDALEHRWMPLVRQLREQRRAAQRTQPLVFVVGNKSDRLGGDYLIDAPIERAWAESIGATAHVVVTATNTHSVHALFVDAVAQALATHRSKLSATIDTYTEPAPTTEDRTLSILDSETMRRHEAAWERRRRHQSSCAC